MKKIFGIDPAPSKKSVVFDGERFYEFYAKELKDFLEKNSDKDTFIGWDAPLGDDFSMSLSYKPIEKIINDKKNYIDHKKPPRGISTLPFSTCPHWSISQYVLGYPIVNHEIVDKSKLKYHQVQKNDDISLVKPNLFETHPAFSLWVFLKDIVQVESWRYKGNKESKKIFKVLKEALFDLDIVKEYKKIKDLVIDDDYLDSFLAFLNVKLFLENKAFVYGDRKRGVMLLPSLEGILKEEVLKTI